MRDQDHHATANRRISNGTIPLESCGPFACRLPHLFTPSHVPPCAQSYAHASTPCLLLCSGVLMDDPMSIFWMAFEDLKDGVPILTQQRLHTNTVYIYIYMYVYTIYQLFLHDCSSPLFRNSRIPLILKSALAQEVNEHHPWLTKELACCSACQEYFSHVEICRVHHDWHEVHKARNKRAKQNPAVKFERHATKGQHWQQLGRTYRDMKLGWEDGA